MENLKPFLVEAKSKAKQASTLWFHGFIEACCLHRVIKLCYRSKKLSIRTGQCFLLNGFIFLGSMFVLRSIVIPALLWILPEDLPHLQDPSSFGGVFKLYTFLRLGLLQLFYVFWFYPMYIFSLILSTLWYNDIAKFGFNAMVEPQATMEKSSSEKGEVTLQRTAPAEKSSGLGGVVIGIGEQLYSLLLLSFFFIEVFAIGFIPYIGKALNFLLLSWMYAYYCFEYKWNLSQVSLDKRLTFFESNWAFFAGFGNPCVLAIFFFSPLVSYGVMAILFPLFVLAATCSRAEQVIDSERRKWRGLDLHRLPIFYAADTLSMWILSLFSLESWQQVQDKKMI